MTCLGQLAGFSAHTLRVDWLTTLWIQVTKQPVAVAMGGAGPAKQLHTDDKGPTSQRANEPIKSIASAALKGG